MMNSYLRGATAALALATLCSPLCLGLPSSTTALAAEAAGGSQAAMIVPAAQPIDSFGYAGSTSAGTSETGSLVASSPLIHSVPQPAASDDQATATSIAANVGPAQVSWMPSIRALGFLSPDDLETKSLQSIYRLKSLHQLERLTTLAQP